MIKNLTLTEKHHAFLQRKAKEMGRELGRTVPIDKVIRGLIEYWIAAEDVQAIEGYIEDTQAEPRRLGEGEDNVPAVRDFNGAPGEQSSRPDGEQKPK